MAEDEEAINTALKNVEHCGTRCVGGVELGMIELCPQYGVVCAGEGECIALCLLSDCQWQAASKDWRSLPTTYGHEAHRRAWQGQGWVRDNTRVHTNVMEEQAQTQEFERKTTQNPGEMHWEQSNSTATGDIATT